MIIYNVTVSVEDDVKEKWLDWMRAEHIPEVMACGIFTKAKISHVIARVDSENTFTIAYSCSSMKELHRYQIKFADKLQKKHTLIFGNKAIAFRTLMEVIEEF